MKGRLLYGFVRRGRRREGCPVEHMPSDPAMLLSLVNMKLRDRYGSLEALCEDLGWEQGALIGRLEAIDYRYCEKQNQFV